MPSATPSKLLAGSLDCNMEGADRTWTTYPDCNHVPNCNEWLAHNGRPHYPIPEIRPGEHIPGLGATTSPSATQLRQPGPFPLLNPCQAKNNILRDRHLPLLHYPPWLRDRFATCMPDPKTETFLFKNSTSAPHGTYEWNTERQERTQGSFLMAPYGAEKNAIDREHTFMECDSSGPGTSPYNIVRFPELSSSCESFASRTSPAQPSCHPGHDESIKDTRQILPRGMEYRYDMIERLRSTSPEPVPKTKIKPLSAEMLSKLHPRMVPDNEATPSTSKVESNFVVVDRPTPNTPKPASNYIMVDHPTSAPPTLPATQAIVRDLQYLASLPSSSVDSPTPRSPSPDSDFELIDPPSPKSSSPSRVSKPAPARARLTSRNLFLSDLEETGYRSPSSSIVNVQLHMAVGEETFEYEPREERDIWLSQSGDEMERLFA